MNHVNIKWCDKEKHYRVSRISPEGEETMFVFYGSLKDAIEAAEYFRSFGDVR